MSDLDEILKEQKKELKRLDKEISAFNVGVNIGKGRWSINNALSHPFNS